jgi:uncharacterized protein
MNAAPLRITVDHLESFAIGAWIMGTGGGGDPYFSLLEAKKHWAEGKSVDLIDPMSLGDDDLIACVGQMGAPLVMQERLCDGPVIAATITMMEKHIGRKFKAIMLWEVGGNNGFQAILAGALLGLPVVDCDAMGRAFPQADMTTFAISGFSAAPWTMVDPRHNSVIFTEAVDWTWMERMTRRVCAVLGSAAATCKAPRVGHEVKSGTCLYTATKAMRIGRTVQDARKVHADPVAAVVESENGMLLFQGKVTDVMRRTTEGWLRGTVQIAGLDANRGETFRLDFQNEWSIGWQNDEVKVTVPDLICLLDSVSGEAIGTETIRYGQRVTVIALPAPAILMSPKGLKHVGPRAFGYDIDFKSIFPDALRVP